MSTSTPSSKKRQRLSFVVRGMLIMLVLGFAFVFFKGISAGHVNELNDSAESSATASLALGQTALRRIAGQRVWITRISESQRAQATTIAPYLVAAERGCATTEDFCAFSAATDQTGVELSFTELAPVQLSGQTPWFGGFVNPTNGAVYDRFGRAYKLNALTTTAALMTINLDSL